MAITQTTAPDRRRPAIPPPIRVRRNVLSLPPNDPIITFYGRAIAEMKKNPTDMTVPMSWRYQAAIHDYVVVSATRDARLAADPNASDSDVLPSSSDRVRFWRTCQHNSWYFQPWHRMYLHHFERIIMSHVAKMPDGPKDWALPYWNYSPSAATRLLPPPFRNPTLADGSPNHLFVAQRDSNANLGQTFADANDTDITRCLNEPLFAGTPGGSPGFGGHKPLPPLTSNHSGGPGTGAVERSPHNFMHGRIAGPSGFMGGFITAPLDPIFWLHHCNIDRLWEVWLRRDPAHKNPITTDWLTSVSFSFHDAAGNVVDMTPSQVEDTKAAPLAYEYDDISDPLKP